MAGEETKHCPSCKQWLARSAFPKKRTNPDGLYAYCKPCNVAKCREYSARRPGWKDHKKAYDRARTQRLKDKLKVQNRERYERNKERVLRQTREWAARNPDKRKAISQSYKHRRRAVERVGMTGPELAAWKEAQVKSCHWCGVKCARGFVVDHVQPLAKGGRHEAGNLVISCRSCNARKAARDPIAFAQEMGRLF